jgi:putative thioredoxin
MSPDFIVDVTETNFEYEVISFSQNIPVIVDFWATWCKPCKILSPMLERLAIEAHGSFRLARLDVDENPTLALRFTVRNIPTVKAFSEGNVVGELVGNQPEARLREFIGKITPPSPLSLALEKADSLRLLHQWTAAEKTYRSILDQNPDHPATLLGLVKTVLAQGRSNEALSILHNFPASRQYNDAEQLLPLGEALFALQQDIMPAENDLDIAFRTCIRLASRGNLPAALDGLLDILRQDKRYHNGQARQMVVALLELLGEDDPQTRQYRSELASILF